MTVSRTRQTSRPVRAAAQRQKPAQAHRPVTACGNHQVFIIYETIVTVTTASRVPAADLEAVGEVPGGHRHQAQAETGQDRSVHSQQPLVRT